MCVIAISPKGSKQPSRDELFAMWNKNPHGAGYMFSRKGKVTIHKGFMNFKDFIRSVRSENFTSDDPVVYHFRISTQGGINPQMTHPFPLSSDFKKLSALDLISDVGIAHNGIIPITTTSLVSQYSDTALFISHYMTHIIRSEKDLKNEYVIDMLQELTHSKLAILTGKGNIYTVGQFFKENGILVSNRNHIFRSDIEYKCIWEEGKWVWEKCIV